MTLGARKEYMEFLERKKPVHTESGITVGRSKIHPMLFDFQTDITLWAIRKGAAAIFADCGLGKTFLQLEWARLIGKKTLIIAPLSVTRQTQLEAEKIDIEIELLRECFTPTSQISITNYEQIDHIDPSHFQAVVLDESSILKSLAGKTKNKLISMFGQTPYRLCCTATPAPNDIAEMANHAEFLGVMSRENMLAAFFVHDDKGWRLKYHAKDAFFTWLASWGMFIKKPSDLGYDDKGFELPQLHISKHFVRTSYVPSGELFASEIGGIKGRAEAKSQTMGDKLKSVPGIIESAPGQWVVWCHLNKEAEALASLIPDSRNVQGSDSVSKKMQDIRDFQEGKYRILITKPKICGFGLNLQQCANMLFFGLTDSWEAYYQCLRRVWRYGQKSEVRAHILMADIEMPILKNVMAKNEQAEMLSRELIKNIASYEKQEIGDMTSKMDWKYNTDDTEGNSYKIMLGDSVERMKEIGDESIHLSVFSPPFKSLYTYTPTERDVGNSKNDEDFIKHFGYIVDELLRITMPGRICAVHVADIPAMLARDGYIGLKDFSGDVIKLFIDRGWIFDARIPIDKNQQAQSIRTHAKGLTMTQMEKDRTWSRPALPDYILKFRKGGINETPVKDGEITRDIWIEYANPTWPGDGDDRCGDAGAFATWYGILESDTLQGWRSAGPHRNNGGKDERHICPLQLETIRRIVLLWSNRGERVFTPFMGIGSEVFVTIQNNRYGIGIELKPEYFSMAKGYLDKLESESFLGFGKET